MRGKIIHYNANDGRGLIAADSRQWPFTIDQWRSDVAPAVNTVVGLDLAGDELRGISRIPDDVLLKEKASQLAGKFGTAGGAALQSIKGASAATDVAAHARGWMQLLGRPLLIAHGLFAVSALLLPYIEIQNPFGMGGRRFTLTGLSEASEAMGASVGGAIWPWLAILSIALPVFWRSRFAWLALLLPLLATLKPAIDMALAANKATRAMGDMLGSEMAQVMTRQVADMVGIGVGAWACLLAALFIAAVAVKRFLRPPSR